MCEASLWSADICVSLFDIMLVNKFCSARVADNPDVILAGLVGSMESQSKCLFFPGHDNA